MSILTRNTAIIILYVFLFYVISLTLGFFSSYVLSKKNYNFRFPLFITSMQNLIHFVLSSFYISICYFVNGLREEDKEKDEQDDLNTDLYDNNHIIVNEDAYRTPIIDVFDNEPHPFNVPKYGNRDIEEYSVLGNDNISSSQKCINENNENNRTETNEKNKKNISNENCENRNLYTKDEKNNSMDYKRENIDLSDKKCINKNKENKMPNLKNKKIILQPGIEDKIRRFNIKNNSREKINEEIDIDMQKSNTEIQNNDYIWKISPYFFTTLPCAITAAVDIGVSSHALRTVSLAFYTMIKSSAPVFVLLSGFLFGIEKPSICLFLTVFIIGSGVFLTTIKTDTVTKSVNLCLSSTTFSLLFASFMAGFRWAFVQYLIEKRKVRNISILYTIKDLCLPISIILFGFSCYFEGIKNILKSEFFQSYTAIRRNVGFILFSGILSFFLLVSEFLLVSKTSVVFLSVSGIVKELIIVFVSVCKKDISFEMVNYGGLTVSIIGLLLYNYMRFRKSKENE